MAISIKHCPERKLTLVYWASVETAHGSCAKSQSIGWLAGLYSRFVNMDVDHDGPSITVPSATMV
jgi:hypothetical protein